MQQPNILLMHSHDTGRELEVYGAQPRTPNFKALAQSGVLFRHAFSVASSCSAARASMHTSMYPHQNGMTGLAHRGWHLKDYDKTIIKLLKDAGYHTALFGEHHIAPNDETDLLQYDQADLVGNYSTEIIADAASQWLTKAPDQPWFLNCGFWDTHRTNYPEVDTNAGLYGTTFPIYPDTPELRRDYAAFQGAVERLDGGIGQVLNALGKAGLADNTLVIATTDHAPGFPEYKANVTDKGLGVYMMMAGPGVEQGRVYEPIVTHLDILPTICDYLGLRPQTWFEGVSLRPALEGDKKPLHTAVYGEANYHAAYEPQRSVRTDRYRFVKRYDQREQLVLPNIDDSASKEAWVNAIIREPQSLFDIIDDPLERRNLVHDPAYRQDVQEIEQQLTDWQKQVDDPLLNGDLHAPAGAEINKPDQTSATQATSKVV